ncbi:class I SAM-dependent methyltransferase [Curtobacterium sp. RRHDQ10]|uniref:class I SAM-dependent methyltransferase n=1 Tax=Curtobacterium phyllosphaerae TaxID=3413379 RepID=UPI003BF1E061
MSVFASTAEFYGAYRSDVPPIVVQRLAEAAPSAGPDGVRRLLDVGTGTGFVITALTAHFDDAIGVDPDPDLLAVASRSLSAQIAQHRVALMHATAEDFTVPSGWRPQLVTVCRAFHWFDRARFLARAGGVLAPHGVLAILGDRSVWAANAPWKTATLDIVREFLGDERRAGAGTYRAPTHDYADDLVEAGYRGVERESIPVRRTRTVESVIGYLHSTSFASLAVLGDRAAAFDDQLAERLTAFVDADGLLVDDNEFTILTANH